MATELKTFRFNIVVLQRFKAICKRYGDMSYHVNEALREYIDKQDNPDIGIAISAEKKKPAAKQVAVVEQIDYSAFNLGSGYIGEIVRIRTKNAQTAKQGKITQRIANALAKEFSKAYAAGFTIDQILDEWEARAWKSFKAEWMKASNPSPQLKGQDSEEFKSWLGGSIIIDHSGGENERIG